MQINVFFISGYYALWIWICIWFIPLSDVQADLKGVFFWLIRWPEYLPQKRNAEFGSIKKKKSNRPIFKSFSEMSKLSQPVTEDKRSPKTNWCALKPVPLTHLLIYTDLQLIVLDLITRPKQWYLKRSRQLARLQVIGLFLYSIAKFMKITKLYIFQRCQEHYAYVTDGSVNWKTSSSYKSSGSFSSPSAKNVGNGGFLLQSL